MLYSYTCVSVNAQLQAGDRKYGQRFFTPNFPFPAQNKKENMIRFANYFASGSTINRPMRFYHQSRQSRPPASHRTSMGIQCTKYIAYVPQATSHKSQYLSLNVSKHSQSPLNSFPLSFCAYYSGCMDSLGFPLFPHSLTLSVHVSKTAEKERRMNRENRQIFPAPDKPLSKRTCIQG